MQQAAAKPEVMAKGVLHAREAAAEELMRVLPTQLHIAYAFAKQDNYKLTKVGLSFDATAGSTTPAEAGNIPGNSLPIQQEPRGTRLCVGGDKVVQSMSQACTASLKKASKILPSRGLNTYQQVRLCALIVESLGMPGCHGSDHGHWAARCWWCC